MVVRTSGRLCIASSLLAIDVPKHVVAKVFNDVKLLKLPKLLEFFQNLPSKMFEHVNT